jgi:hypothetical protein
LLFLGRSVSVLIADSTEVVLGIPHANDGSAQQDLRSTNREIMELLGPTVALYAVFPTVLVFFVLYSRFLDDTLKKRSAHSLTMTPSLIWLMIIPIFGVIWQFFVVRALSQSFDKEYCSRGLPWGFHGLRSLGIAKAVVDVVSFPPIVMACALYFPIDPEAGAPVAPILGYLCGFSFLASIPLGITCIVLWIAYFSRVSGARTGLERYDHQASWEGRHPLRPPPCGSCPSCGIRFPGGHFCPRCGARQH